MKRVLVVSAAIVSMAASGARAAYPDKPLKLVLPNPPGGAGDLMGRQIAQKLSSALGQAVVVDNRAGASGTLAAEAVAAAAPDGLTLMAATMQTHAINVSLLPRLRYDPIRDFAPISMTHTLPRVLVVHPSVGVSSMQELIALAKKMPDKLTYSSAGNGSTSHLAGVLFNSMAGIRLVHVPYKGSAPALNDLLAGRISMTFDSVAVWRKHIEAGKVKPLGVTSLRRMALLPSVPTISEQGLTGYEMTNWLGVVAPAGTPRDIVNRLNAELGRAMADAEVRKTLFAVAIEPQHTTPEEFGAIIKADIERWSKVVRESGAKVD